MFENATFVSVDCACSGLCIQGTQSFIEIQKSTPRDVVFIENQVDFDKRPLLGENCISSQNKRRQAGFPFVWAQHSACLVGLLVGELAQRCRLRERRRCHSAKGCV